MSRNKQRCYKRLKDAKCRDICKTNTAKSLGLDLKMILLEMLQVYKMVEMILTMKFKATVRAQMDPRVESRLVINYLMTILLVQNKQKTKRVR